MRRMRRAERPGRACTGFAVNRCAFVLHCPNAAHAVRALLTRA